MRQIDVDLRFDDDGEAVEFFDNAGNAWPFDNVIGLDWKENTADAKNELSQKGAEVVVLFDGSDAIWLASMADVRKASV